MASLNIKMEDQLKQAFQAACSELGMDMTTAITVFAKKVSREHRIPFEVSSDPFYTEDNITRLEKAIESLEAGNGKAHELITD